MENTFDILDRFVNGQALTDEEFAQWHDYARSLDDTFREYIGADTFDKVMAAVKADTEAHS